MKELKILAVVVTLVAVMFYGIEPYAHHVMHPEPAPVDFEYSDLKTVDSTLKGDVTNGKALVEMNCIACHSIESEGFAKMMPDADAASAYGVTPPDLSIAGHIYNKNYLVNFIANPTKAMKVEGKYSDNKPFPMPNYDWMSAQELNDMAAYLASIKHTKKETVIEQRKEVFEAACVRCHSMQYAGIAALTPEDIATKHFGSTPPDLSQMIKSRGHHFLESFINDPQQLLHGTAMPRVGLTAEAQEEVNNGKLNGTIQRWVGVRGPELKYFNVEGK